MILLVLLTIIPCVLTMNSLSARGHAALWKKHARNDPLPATIVKTETPHSSSPQAMNIYQSPCSPSFPCAKNSELPVNTAHQDTPKSIEIEASEEQDDSSPPPAITCERSKDSLKYFFKKLLLYLS